MAKRKIPHTFVIVFFIIIIASILTWFIPGGRFERQKKIVNGVEREIIINNSFSYTENNPQTWQIFSAFFDGFKKTSHIIVFILMIGGAFWIMNQSKAIDVGIYTFLSLARGLESKQFIRFLGVDNIVIALIMLIFSLFGAIFGMSEETIAFVVIFVPLAITMGYDSIVGVSMCFVAAALGFAGAMLNPFTIGIAQGLSDIPLYSGIGYRLICWLIITSTGIFYVLRYAKKIRRNPEKSVVFEDDAYWRKNGTNNINEIKFHTPKSAWVVYILISVVLIIYAFVFTYSDLKIGNTTVKLPVLPIISVLFIVTGIFALRKSLHFFNINLLLFTILALLVGVTGYDWYVKEIATLFLAMGILAGIAMNSSPNKIVNDFLAGAKDILPAAAIVGLAGGIVVILEDGKIIDTLLYYTSQSISDLGKITSVGIMYMFQTLLNIAVPSGSGQAALTIPIMSQLSDLIGISRQTTVMVFQFGDGFTNMITPTSGVLIGVLGVARVPYEKWVRWVAPFMVILIILGFLLLIPTVTMDLEGF